MDVTLEGAAAVVAVLVALGTYVASTRRERSIRRAELIRQYTADFYASDDVVALFADLDYDRFTFVADQETWLGQKPERTVVRMLDLFNSVGHHWHRRVVTLADLHGTTLGYAILRAYENADVVRYLQHVRQWDHDHLGTGVPFEYFQRLAAELKVLSAATRAVNRDRPAIVPPSSHGVLARVRSRWEQARRVLGLR